MHQQTSKVHPPLLPEQGFRAVMREALPAFLPEEQQVFLSAEDALMDDLYSGRAFAERKSSRVAHYEFGVSDLANLQFWTVALGAFKAAADLLKAYRELNATGSKKLDLSEVTDKLRRELINAGVPDARSGELSRRLAPKLAEELSLSLH